MTDKPHDMGFAIRNVMPDADVPRLARLLGEIEATDGIGEVSSEEAVREAMTWPGHDPTRDRWVVEQLGQPDRLIAHALVWKGTRDTRAEVAVAVHPAWRRRGLGSLLLRQALDRARESGAIDAGGYADEEHEAATLFLRRHGFTPVAAFTEMRYPAEPLPERPPFPAGYRVRTYDEVRDLPVLAQTMTVAYSGLWGHHVVDENDLAHWLPNWPLDGIFLLYDESDAVAGICRAELRESPDGVNLDQPAGYVDAPGISPERRAADLYVPLLLTAMRWLRARGVGAIGLESWGDAEETLARYQEIGFRIARRAVSYHLAL